MLIQWDDIPQLAPYVREGGINRNKPWTYPERRLLDYLLVYIQEGIFNLNVDEQNYLLQPGEFGLVQPGSLVALEGITDTIVPFIHFDLFFNPKRSKSFPTKPGQVDLSAYAELIQPRINQVYGIDIPVRVQPYKLESSRSFFIQAVELSHRRHPLDQLRAQHLITEIIISILDTYGRNSKPHAYSFDWITSYLSHHLNEPIRVEDMARRANLSISRFSSMFKQQFGMSPHQYLLVMRIGHAKELLSQSQLTLEQIASYCGFADMHHFSKAFKKKTGLTPGQWRSKT
ncbi:helix-turn-helix domain-containing protein [Paenibacillus sp. NPDC056579]|uniref:AraC family transcriptional regulator n=1 Tax=Paenibacillus sp. NPDC056579 TaxID=3345871 RepID=UPI0036872A74